MSLAFPVDDTPAASSVASSLYQRLATWTALVLFAWFGIDAAIHRGPWLDEFWTLWLSQRDLPITELFYQRWLGDLHPPLFSFGHWLSEPWTQDSYIRHRLLNLLPLLWAGSFVALSIRRYPSSASVLCVALILWLSMPTTLEYFAEMRSYFTQMSLVFVVVGAVIVIFDASGDFDPKRDRLVAFYLSGSIFLLFNLNYIGAAVAGLVLAVALLVLMRAGRNAWVKVIVVTAIVSSLPVIAFVIAQHSTLSTASGGYWVKGGLWDAIVTLRRMVRRVLEANELITVAALCAFALAVVRLLGSRIGAARSRVFDFASIERARLRLLLTLLGGALAFAVLLMIAQSQHPIATSRYLLVWQIIVIGLVALLAAQLFRRYLPIWLVAIIAVAAFHQSVAARAMKAEARWNSSFALVKAELADCPGAEVLATSFPRPSFMENGDAVRQWGYERMAKWGQLHIRFIEPGSGLSFQGADSCPTLIWVEHADWSMLSRESDVATMLHYLGWDGMQFDLSQSRARIGETGFVLVLPRRQ